MTNKLTKRTITLLVPANADKHTRSRMGKYTAWLTATGTDWKSPDLAAYRDHLLVDHSTATVKAHLSTVRAQYGRLLRDNTIRDMLFSMALGDANPADKKAFVDEALIRLANAIDPKNSPVSTTIKQDVTDASQTRLTRRQAEDLMNAPGIDTLKGKRDTAIIALCLCTGIREEEVCNLVIPDLRQYLGGELAIHVRHGKGNKERLIPYGELDWCLVLVDSWIKAAEITEGAVFRSYYEGFRKQRPNDKGEFRLSVRAVELIIRSYYIPINGELRSVAPHDLRRSYARALFDSGMPILAISQNLGHANIKTTQGYIGPLDDSTRAPSGDIYRYDVSKLRNHNHS
jgi:integrase